MNIDTAQFDEALALARARLLAMASPAGHWVGELSASALSTAIAAFALAMIDAARGTGEYQLHVNNAFAWLVAHQNADGGWGDTTDSPSNLSTTLLAWSALGVREGSDPAIKSACKSAQAWLTREAGSGMAQRGTGVPPVSSSVHSGRRRVEETHGQDAHATPADLARAVYARYGNDRTFSAPILTMCVLAGRLGAGRDAWRWVAPLPFELAACPHRWLGALGLPVVSYALPALIAIGQARFVHLPPICPVTRLLRKTLKNKTLAILASAQPPSGGFLEAAPLTSFVAMSLASIGLAGNPVVTLAAKFLTSTVRSDGSWAIDTNMATWVTTLAVNALADSEPPALPPSQYRHIVDWLLGQQLQSKHPYTHAAPGGWAWTDLSGGVPDADDTAGALVALAGAGSRAGMPDLRDAGAKGVAWLVGLQNRDGGIPTFCRGWGKMPFDRSCPDLTAHAIRAWLAWRGMLPQPAASLCEPLARAIRYLQASQRADGSWLPLWFGNQHAPRQENPVYGTSRVVATLTELNLDEYPAVPAMLQRAASWLMAAQNSDGGWGGENGVASSTEETALAVEAIARTIRWAKNSADKSRIELANLRRSLTGGVNWLIAAIGRGDGMHPSPIGLYFASLWYSQSLYAIIFTVAALGQVWRAYHEAEAR
jgi:squalene-hopene/tetraprenyl-beta-curcumene cyclase